MLTSQGVFDVPFANAVTSDSVGDIHVRATFEMSDHIFIVDNFKVFDQKAGYKGVDHSRNISPVVEVWGAPDPSHMGLYYASDLIHKVGTQVNSGTSPEFDVLFEIYQGDIVLRAFDYNDCMITNYVFTTLHDGEETFSGKTQFVYADVFEMECSGYQPLNPLLNQYIERAKNTSSHEYKQDQRPTWSAQFRTS
jgi:hypothetical protein